MATGLTVADDDISVGGRVSPGAQLSRVKTYLFTESTDLTVNTAVPTGVNFSSSQSIVIPTKGLIRLSFAGEVTGVTTNFYLYLGLNDSVAAFWGHYVDNGTAVYAYLSNPVSGQTDLYYGFNGPGASSANVMPITLPIEELGIATGTRTIQILVAASDTNSHTIDGSTGSTVTPAQVYMEVSDFT
jgi:hypothetical protein